MGKGTMAARSRLVTDTAALAAEVPPPSIVLHVGLGALIALCVLLGALAVAHNLYRQNLAEQHRDLRNLAVTLADQSDRALQILDIVQRSVLEPVGAAEVATPEQFNKMMASQSVHQELRERMAGLPYLSAISIVDNHGDLLNYTRGWPVPKISAANRGYFIALSSMKGAPTFVSAPLQNLVTGRPTIFLARRITGSDGAFLGLILVAIEQSAFEQTFTDLELPHTGLIALVRDDGVLLASHPRTNTALLSSPGAAARARLVAALAAPRDDDVEVPAGTLDHQARLVATQPLPHFPLSVVVSESAAHIRWTAIRAALPILLASLLVLGLIALVILLMVRQLKRTHAFSTTEHCRARIDPLTGLPNRLMFSERLAASLAALKGAASGPPLALLQLDLDFFKAVNDTLGHDVGDGLLQAVAERLDRTVGQEGLIARLGGDEFAIVCATDEHGAHALGRRAISAIGAPFMVNEHQVLTGCSVGIAMAPRDGTDVATLLKSADLALYGAKADGRSTTRAFRDEMSTVARSRREMELDLHQAWEENQFTVVYQPIFEVVTGVLTGFEALLRWHHPRRGEVPPETFIPVAEECGLILNLGGFVLKQACATAAHWPDPLFVSVNVSAAQFRGGQVAEQVFGALAMSGLPPRRLELEITESLLLNADGPVRALLDRFRSEGIELALDDFGTGYSSLRYLRQLNIGRLKVDQSFVSLVEEDPHMRAVVTAILSLAKALGLKTTAEGVETKAQFDFLTREGCTHLQGYMLGTPMTENDVRRMVDSIAA